MDALYIKAGGGANQVSTAIWRNHQRWGRRRRLCTAQAGRPQRPSSDTPQRDVTSGHLRETALVQKSNAAQTAVHPRETPAQSTQPRCRADATERHPLTPESDPKSQKPTPQRGEGQ